MSSFQCPVVRVTVEPHPNADAIELAHVGGFISIVKKGQFQTGDLAIYVPEDSVLPEWLLKLMGFWDDMNNKGKLSNSAGNRVRAMKLRGIVSQGLLVPFAKDEDKLLLPEPGEHPELGVGYDFYVVTPEIDQDFAERLGITKYEVPIPQHLAGRVAGGDLEACFLYDFENIKAREGIFSADDNIIITEKLHGTQFQCGLIPESIWTGKPWAEKSPLYDGGYRGTVTSKGLSKQGLLLDPSDLSNVYVRTAIEQALWAKLWSINAALGLKDTPIFIFGEVYGAGLQKGFTYGHLNTPTFAAFDIVIGGRNAGKFLPFKDFLNTTFHYDIPIVPVLFMGFYDPAVIAELTNGKTTLGGAHIREGVVVKCANEILDKRYGRRIVKSVSNDYLLDKKGTDYQ